jgi:hypothetical protein
MITLENDRLIFRFPEVHPEASCSFHFQRTLRIPEDGKNYPLPAGLGAFPLRHLDDYARNIPGEWLKRGGVVMPMYQAEALWIHFGGGRGRESYPFAVKIATGKVNAVSGEPWTAQLNRDPQDYIVVPTQPWLDGYCVAKGVIRQFVAMPLGEGYSVEEQLFGEPRWGGVQILVYPMKAEKYETLCADLSGVRWSAARYCLAPPGDACRAPDMGLAPGGRMKQEIYDDPYRLEDWDQRHASRCFVTIANSVTWHAITGERPPMRPPAATDYAKAGLPWFDYYDADAKALEGSDRFVRTRTVAQMAKHKGEEALPGDVPIEIEHVIQLRKQRPTVVREAAF